MKLKNFMDPSTIHIILAERIWYWINLFSNPLTDIFLLSQHLFACCSVDIYIVRRNSVLVTHGS